MIPQYFSDRSTAEQESDMSEDIKDELNIEEPELPESDQAKSDSEKTAAEEKRLPVWNGFRTAGSFCLHT